MKTLLSTSLRPCCPGHCRGSCCFLGIHYLTMERATANRMCPAGSRGPSQSQRKGAGLGFHSAENMSAALSHALSAWSQAVFSEASRNGDI